MKPGSEVTFKRELSEQFMRHLAQGHLAPLLAAARQHGLDVHLRGECRQTDYISLYHRGYCALKLEDMPRAGYRATISRAFVSGTRLDLGGGRDHATFSLADADAVTVYVQELPFILANIETKRIGERHAEGCLCRNSQAPSSPVVFIDRQVAQSKDEGPGDLVGLMRVGSARFVLAEVKYRENPDIADLSAQLSRYGSVMVDDEGRLKAEFAESYRRVLAQRQRVGLAPPDLVFPTSPVAVEYLIILCDYNEKSPLWTRADARLRAGAMPARLIRTVAPGYAIPPLGDWEVIR